MMPSPSSPQEQQLEAEMRRIEDHVAAIARRPRNWVREKKLGDHFRGRNEITADLPPIEQLEGAYILIWHQEKPVLVRHNDDLDRWQIPGSRFSARRGRRRETRGDLRSLVKADGAEALGRAGQ